MSGIRQLCPHLCWGYVSSVLAGAFYDSPEDVSRVLPSDFFFEDLEQLKDDISLAGSPVGSWLSERRIEPAEPCHLKQKSGGLRKYMKLLRMVYCASNSNNADKGASEDCGL